MPRQYPRFPTQWNLIRLRMIVGLILEVIANAVIANILAKNSE